MKLLLVALLVIGVSAKDKLKDNKISIHEMVYKDDNILNFGEVGKVKIHQRLDNLNIDATQRHLLGDISVNVDRCINNFNEDYKTNKDVQKYRYSVGNLVGIVLRQIDYFQRNNLFNNVDVIDNLNNRLRLCDVVIRDTDVTNQGVDWRDTYNRDTTDRDVNVNRYNGGLFDTNVNRDGGNYYRNVDRNTYRDDFYGRGVGDNVNRFGVGYDYNNDRTYGRFQRSLNVDNNGNNDLGVVGWYRVFYGLVNDDDGDRNVGYNQYRNNYGYNYNRYDKNGNYYGYYGNNRFDNNRGYDYNGNYGYNYNRYNGDRDTYGNYGVNRYDYYRNILGYNRNDNKDRFFNSKIGNRYDNNNYYWNRYNDNQDVYGYNRYDNNDYGRGNLNYGVGGDADVYGRRTGNYNTDYIRRDNNYNRYSVGGRDNRVDTYVD